MTLKVSVSSLDTYESCPRKYKFQQIDKLPRKTWEHLDVGNYVHEVLEHFHKELNADASQQPEALLKQIAKNTWNKFSTKISAEGMEKSKGLLKSYLAYVASDGWPEVLATEDRFSIQINPDLLIRGVVDRIDRTPNGYQILDYKGLALDTPIPTPSGWTTMGDLKVGDKVFGSDGRAVDVILKSEIHHRPCYRLTLSDGSSVVCDNVHLWGVTEESADGSSAELCLDTDQLFGLLQEQLFMKKRYFIKNPLPLQYPEARLPVDPRSLGLQIGGHATCSEGEIINRIPAKYLSASYNQRLCLLQGVMDSGGEWKGARGLAVFCTSSLHLANDVVSLVRSLGISTKVRRRVGSGTRYMVAFRPAGFVPFVKHPAAERASFVAAGGLTLTGSRRRRITSIESTESVPTQCIGVDAPDHLYVGGEGMSCLHNTGQSKYLDKFQLQVYGMHLKNLFPDLQEYDGVYLVLPEGPKKLSYRITLSDIEEAKDDIIKTAEQIATDKTWEPKPTFLCKYCDYYDACPDGWGKGKSGGSDLVKISGRKKF